MARAALRQIVLGLAATGLLLGCVEGGGQGTADGSGMTAAPTKKKGGNVDVEAPEVFQATDSALWDGRPSLGGIWVASPEVTSPERALMFNPANGKSVTGALFKRERENPGPRLQLSSDAAEALGILAGQPTEIQVTALRKEVVEEPTPEAAPVEEATAVAAAEGAAPTDPAATDPAAKPAAGAEAAAIASAALDAVDAGAAAAPAAGEAAEAVVDPAAAAAGAAVTVDEKPARKTWKERRAEAKAAREAKKKAAADAKAAASGAATDGAVAEVPAEAAGVAAIETAPLDARSPEASGAAETSAAAEPEKVTVPETPKAAAEATPEAVPEPTSTSTTTGSRPIQVASFSKEDNAKRAAEALAKIDITATPQKSDQGGKSVWGVVVMGDDAMLKKIKGAGFADAYFLK